MGVLLFCVNIMASSSTSMGDKMTPKLVVFKFQGIPPVKSRFNDDNSKIRDTKLGHIDLGEFLKICDKPTKRSAMVSTLIHLGLVNAASHPVSIQSSELIMKLAQHFVLEERVVKSVTGEIFLDL